MRSRIYLLLVAVGAQMVQTTIPALPGVADCSTFAACSDCVLANCTWFEQNSMCNSSRPAISDDLTFAQEFGFRNATLCGLSGTPSAGVASTVESTTVSTTAVAPPETAAAANNQIGSSEEEEQGNNMVESSLESRIEEGQFVLEKENDTHSSLESTVAEQEAALEEANITQDSLERGIAEEAARLEQAKTTLEPSLIDIIAAQLEQANYSEASLEGLLAEEEAELEQANITLEEAESNMNSANETIQQTQGNVPNMNEENQTAPNAFAAYLANLTIARTVLNASQRAMEMAMMRSQQANSTFQRAQEMAQNATSALNAARNRLSQAFGGFIG